MLESGQLSDFTITCQGHKWQAHKIILITKSEFFRAAILSGFSEATKSTMDLPEDDPAIIARLLLHMYTGEYPTTLPTNPMSQLAAVKDQEPGSASEATEFAVKGHLVADLFAACVKYGVPTLQKLTAIALREAYTTHWEDVEEHVLGIPAIFDIALKIYTNTPDNERALRDTLVDAILEDRRVNSSYSQELEGNYLKMIVEVPALAIDVLQCCQSPLWKCKLCDTPSRVLIRPCACPLVADVCTEVDCVAQYVQDSACWGCHETGTVAPTDFNFGAGNNPES